MPIDDVTLQRSAIFKLFWGENGDADLPNGGLNELSPDGARDLHEYALDHEADGSRSAPGQKRVDAQEREIVRTLLEHEFYGDFMELDGRVTLADLFDVESAGNHGAVGERVDEGEIQLPARVSEHSAPELSSVRIDALPDLFTSEYNANRAFFEGSDIPVEERSQRTLGLLRDYSQALWSHGESPKTEEVAQSLLDAFEQTRYGRVLGNKSYNGAPWSVAQGLVLGVDPNAFAMSFPEARSDVPTTYLNMSDSMAAPMKYVDEFRTATGGEAGAEAHERAPVLNWLIGEPSGHHKPGSLDEKRPFSTTDVNFGLVLFPGDAEIRNLPVQEGFDFPIDLLDGFKRFITVNDGDRIDVVDRNGNSVRMEKELQRDAAGNAVSWSVRFFDRQTGTEIQPGDVLGVVKDGAGRTKGDGKADHSVSMGWWGFCDRNTAQRLYKAMYGIPQLDVEGTVKIRAGDRILEVPVAEAQKIIDMDVSDLVTRNTFTGFRFNDEPQTITLTNGERLVGRVDASALGQARSADRVGGDTVSFSDFTGPVKVQLQSGETREIPAAEIARIVGETQHELSLSNFLVYVSANEGMYATDSSTGVIVSNGMRWTNAIDFDVREGEDRPDWAGNAELQGIHGPLERTPGDRLVFARGMYGNGGAEAQHTGFSGWLQLSKSGRIVNEGFISGEPDFAWGATGSLNWNATSSFNPYMQPEMRLALLVNGVSDLKTDGPNTDALAERLNLPSNWRSYRAN